MKYDPDGSLTNPYVHLCNSSINKHHSDYVTGGQGESDTTAHKWPLRFRLLAVL